ncbi:hypothetical protein [Pelagibius sp.]|uniref:hypothetical protein n=1 Tax=Pelagibius sp. TaxID=1931238 RepID=UPI002605D9E5|nr:hypothetical protein [Pelagibius sp.]
MNEKELVDFLLATATTYAASTISIFNLFLTVAFGSLAFSAALSLRSIGKSYKIWRFRFSSSSLLIALALLAFYVIDFIAFLSVGEELKIVLNELDQQIESWSFKNSNTKKLFDPAPSGIGDLKLSAIGFLIGSTASLVGFLWFANADRSANNRG